MALVRCVTEMGMGVDVHGLDYTAAAKRAVFDAIHHSSLGFPRLVGKTADDMRVDVTIGVPKPEGDDRRSQARGGGSPGRAGNTAAWRRARQRSPRRIAGAQRKGRRRLADRQRHHRRQHRRRQITGILPDVQAAQPLRSVKNVLPEVFLVSRWSRGHHECAQPSHQLSQPKRKPISLNAPAIDTSPVRRYSVRKQSRYSFTNSNGAADAVTGRRAGEFNSYSA